MPYDTERHEIERIKNLLDNFGWSVIKEETNETEMIITIKKERPGIQTETPDSEA